MKSRTHNILKNSECGYTCSIVVSLGLEFYKQCFTMMFPKWARTEITQLLFSIWMLSKEIQKLTFEGSSVPCFPFQKGNLSICAKTSAISLLGMLLFVCVFICVPFSFTWYKINLSLRADKYSTLPLRQDCSAYLEIGLRVLDDLHFMTLFFSYAKCCVNILFYAILLESLSANSWALGSGMLVMFSSPYSYNWKCF